MDYFLYPTGVLPNENKNLLYVYDEKRQMIHYARLQVADYFKPVEFFLTFGESDGKPATVIEPDDDIFSLFLDFPWTCSVEIKRKRRGRPDDIWRVRLKAPTLVPCGDKTAAIQFFGETDDTSFNIKAATINYCYSRPICFSGVERAGAEANLFWLFDDADIAADGCVKTDLFELISLPIIYDSKNKTCYARRQSNDGHYKGIERIGVLKRILGKFFNIHKKIFLSSSNIAFTEIEGRK